jgi:hypothetical protein
MNNGRLMNNGSRTAGTDHLNPIARITLIVAYSILALAALGRSSFEISTKFGDAPLPYTVSAISAVLYTVITFALWRGKDRLALIGSSIELVGVLTAGTLGYIESNWWPDKTVWTGYGSGYGWIPLILPMLALWALIRARRGGAAEA